MKILKLALLLAPIAVLSAASITVELVPPARTENVRTPQPQLLSMPRLAYPEAAKQSHTAG